MTEFEKQCCLGALNLVWNELYTAVKLSNKDIDGISYEKSCVNIGIFEAMDVIEKVQKQIANNELEF